jgi:hypothetical protein
MVNKIKELKKFTDCSMPSNEKERIEKAECAAYNKALDDVLNIMIPIPKPELAFTGKGMVVVNNSMKEPYGWLSPSGDYYPCEFATHDDLADRLCEWFNIVSDNNTNELEVLGWVRIHSNDDAYDIFISHLNKLTEIQSKRINLYCRLHKVIYNNQYK